MKADNISDNIVNMSQTSRISHDVIINEIQNRVAENEQQLRDKISQLLSFVRDHQYDSLWVQLAARVEERNNLTSKEVDEVRKAYKESAKRIADGKVHGVPFIWKLLPVEWKTLVADIVHIRLHDIPALQQRIERRTYEVVKGLKKTTAVARDAASVSHIRDKTTIHSVWTIVAKHLPK